MIDQIYINEAIRIREEYLNNLIYIANEEEYIKSLSSDLKTLNDEISQSEKKDEQYYRDALFEVDLMIRKATDKINPYYDKVKELDKKQRTLYNTIKDKYPDITDEQLQKDIIPHIVEIDKKYKEKYGNILNN
jgi:hypothetical protein